MVLQNLRFGLVVRNNLGEIGWYVLCVCGRNRNFDVWNFCNRPESLSLWMGCLARILRWYEGIPKS